MKWLIASDLHGSETCCKRLLDAFDREGADRLLLLGDILGHGQSDDAVANMLNGRKDAIRCVQGNCDTLLDQEKLAFPMKAGYDIFPVVSGVMMFVTHGHIYNGENRPDSMRKGDILIHGHTHVPATDQRADFYCFNPGSVSLPRWGSERSYMTLENGVFLWKTLDGIEYRRYEL